MSESKFFMMKIVEKYDEVEQVFFPKRLGQISTPNCLEWND